MVAATNLTPDKTEIRRDLIYMTRRWHELGRPVMMEIRAFKEDRAPQINKYDPAWMDDAVEFAAGLNAMGYNVYAVRNPIRQECKGSASDEDIAAAFFLWADCDDEGAAGNVLRFGGPKWTAAVTTGKIPSTRAHVYWELSEPCLDLAAWRQMQSDIAAHFQSDRTVINPSRIMRIGGTVSWPANQKRQRGYVDELTTIRTEYPELREPVRFEQMRRVFTAATPPAPSAPALQIDTGGQFSPALDRERATIQALSGMEWHNAVIRLVASYVARGLSDTEIHALTGPLTLPGYTAQDTAREVQTAIDGARRKGWTPESYASPAAIVAKPPEPSPFDAPRRAPDVEWFDDVQPALGGQYLVKGVLDAGAMSVVYGPSNSGKTFFAIDLAYHIAIGAPWRGRRVSQSAVLYLAAEGGNGVANRIVALRQEHGVCDVPLALKRAGMDLLHDQADLQHIADLAAAVAAGHAGKPLLIVIDTLSRIMAGGDENNAADMTALIRNIDGIRAATGAHVMLVHHTGKDVARGARGHSSLRAATDTEIEVGNDNGARAAMVTKQRDHQGGETFAFALKSVSLGNDQDGDEVTSCVVEAQEDEGAQHGKSARKGIGGNQKIIADTFDQMLAEGMGRPNPGGVGLPEPGQFWTVRMDDLRTYSQGKMAASNKRGAFIEAWKGLSDVRGLFCAASEIVWAVDRRVK